MKRILLAIVMGLMLVGPVACDNGPTAPTQDFRPCDDMDDDILRPKCR
jgi:hypothetical protein